MLAVLGVGWHGADMRPLDLLSRLRQHGPVRQGLLPAGLHRMAHLSARDVCDAVGGGVGHGASLVCAVPCGLMSAHNMAPMWVVQPCAA